MNTPQASKAKDDDLAFLGSSEPTLGVELEIQILDRDSGDLAPGAVPILKMCAEVAAELMRSMIEVRTGVCRHVREVKEQLLPILTTLFGVSSRSLNR